MIESNLTPSSASIQGQFGHVFALEATARDAAGNVSLPATATLLIRNPDNRAPQVALTSPAAGAAVTALTETAGSIVDLELPVSGIPITITRTYDTLRSHEQGDFGYGWTMDIANVKVDVIQPGSGSREPEPLFDYDRIVFTLPLTMAAPPRARGVTGVVAGLLLYSLTCTATRNPVHGPPPSACRNCRVSHCLTGIAG